MKKNTNTSENIVLDYLFSAIHKNELHKGVLSVVMMLLLLLTTGCEKFLEKDPTFIVKENFYNNETDVNAGLAGVYDILGREQLYGDRLAVDFSIADEGFYNRSSYTSGPAVYNFDASNSDVANAWKYLYEGIERANVFLSRIDGVSMDEKNKTAAKGEVKFLRAYYYFLLVTNWGDVPLKTEPTSSVDDIDIARTPQKDVYDFITAEMEASEAMVKTATEIGYGGKVSKSAVRGILARVYLKMAGYPLNGGRPMYEEALKWAKKVVDPEGEGKEHRLLPSYKQIFINYAADRYDIGESIWEVEFYGNRGGDFEAGRIGNTLGLQCNEEIGDGHGFSYGLISTTKKLFDSYEATDLRRDWNIAPYQYTYRTVNNTVNVADSTFWTATQIYNRNCGKFRRVYESVKPKNKNYTPQNYPLLRYADVLLMLVEAENEVNGATAYAVGYLKEVRDRANASDITNTVLGNPEALKTALRKERFIELAFEGLRKFDLIRWGIFVSEMDQLGTDISATAGSALNFGALAGNNVTSRNNLLPIPVLELSLNKAMVQNEGW
ncbi:RagB/SusD family nutrient uptake outer membrane protein [Desertivirga xinjiangensis]|uniref:RagB/SusD family nutrient uptake outer membrane protein n=1 Tax=Desertivirga xinjiangensis TaxID=539206 RepID=UPI002109143D|nr:RagB/SusD family nutrient uptake outer membrane protein [Pedobacter xinjiangensis]